MKIACLGGIFSGQLGLVKTQDDMSGQVGVLPKEASLVSIIKGERFTPTSFIDLKDAVFAAPLLPSARIICVGLNFRSHLEETGLPIPTKPSMFPRYRSSFVAPLEDIILPIASEQFDYEVELAVIIGKPGRHIAEKNAESHIFGYTCLAENSVRDWQVHNRQVFPGKNFDKSGAVGPWIVTADEMPDFKDIQLETKVNGKQRQFGKTGEMIFSPSQCIAYLSTVMMLQPGDIIALGTPGGVAFGTKDPQWLKDGDSVEMKISGIGTLKNTVRLETSI